MLDSLRLLWVTPTGEVYLHGRLGEQSGIWQIPVGSTEAELRYAVDGEWDIQKFVVDSNDVAYVG